MVISQPLLRYVSFRKNDRIYWTRKPVALRAGETLLTDGNHSARARCGNQVSETPQLPVLADEPPAETWEKPVEDPAAGEVADTPPQSPESTPAHAPRVTPEVFVAPNFVRLAVDSPPPSSSGPFFWAGARTGGLIPFNPTAAGPGTLSVNVPDFKPNPPDAHPVEEPPTGTSPPDASTPPPVIVFAGPPPSAPRPPHLGPGSPRPYVPPTLEVPGVPSNPPAPPQTPTDGPPPGDPPIPPSYPPLPPVVPPSDPPVVPAPIPEPAVYLLVGCGLLLLGACRSVR